MSNIFLAFDIPIDPLLHQKLGNHLALYTREGDRTFRLLPLDDRVDIMHHNLRRLAVTSNHPTLGAAAHLTNAVLRGGPAALLLGLPGAAGGRWLLRGRDGARLLADLRQRPEELRSRFPRDDEPWWTGYDCECLGSVQDACEAHPDGVLWVSTGRSARETYPV